MSFLAFGFWGWGWGWVGDERLSGFIWVLVCIYLDRMMDNVITDDCLLRLVGSIYFDV